MGRFLSTANQQVRKIEYFYKNGVYSQALPHFDQLSEIYKTSASTKTGKADASVIVHLVKDAQKKMDEMKKRQDDTKEKGKE